MYIISGLLLGFFGSPTCPSNALEIRQGLKHGFRLAAIVGIGAVSGDCLVLIAVLVGLMSLLEAWPVLGTFIWFVGGLVLLYMARDSLIQSYRGVWMGNNLQREEVIPSRMDNVRAFWSGFTITVTNPYTALWWVGLLGGSGLAVREGLPLVFIGSIIIGTLTWFIGLAGLLQFARYRLNRTFWTTVLILAGISVGGYGLYFLWHGTIEVHSLLYG